MHFLVPLEIVEVSFAFVNIEADGCGGEVNIEQEGALTAIYAVHVNIHDVLNIRGDG